MSRVSGVNPGRRRRWLALGVLALLLGCRSADVGAERAAPTRDQEAAGEEKADAAPTAADPWARTPGGPAGGPQPAAAVVRFVEPGDPIPVAPERRPALPGEALLAVVAVRDGRLAPEGDLVLRLSAELSQEAELRAVVGPGGAPDPPQVDLAGLARLAAASARHLLLVDVRPSRQAGGLRDGYLVHAASGALLACWTARAEPPPVPTGEAADLCARIAVAHGRLDD